MAGTAASDTSSGFPLPVLSQIGRMALVGSPNSGKSTLFNALTGLRAKVANYPGVTVERVEGEVRLPSGRHLQLVDLPGVYSTDALSIEEDVALKVVQGKIQGCPPVDGLIFVADATSLKRSLPLVGAFLKMRIPIVLVLTMIDEIKARGGAVQPEKLQEELGIPVLGIVGTRGLGIDDLKSVLSNLEGGLVFSRPTIPDDAVARAGWADQVLENAYSPPRFRSRLTDILDSVLLHPVLGVLVFSFVMLFFFQAIFSWAAPLQDMLVVGVAQFGAGIRALLPDSMVRDVLVDGIVTGVGSVVVFIPQIAMLFALLTLLEQLGYMSRAVFLIDRLMGWIGLDGRSFVAFLSAYACAIPGIMAARNIPDERSRLSTILVSPFMTCSARLPVYTLIIAAFVPAQVVFGFLNLQGLVMFALYLLGATTAMLAATLLRRGLMRGQTVPFYIELPPYRIPAWRTFVRAIWMPVYRFLRRAGTVILVASVVLWAMLTFPVVTAPASVVQQGETAVQSYQIQHSAGGTLGKLLEPVFEPLGFDWRISIGLVASLAAREVIVATLAQIYAVEGDVDHLDSLAQILPDRLTPPNARAVPGASLAVALSLLMFFVFALQCVSTMAIMRRETGSRKWPAIAFVCMFAIAYSASWLVYNATLWLSA